MKRADLAALIPDVDNKDEIVNQIMAMNGKDINELKAKHIEFEDKIKELELSNAEKLKEYEDFKTSVADYEELKNKNEIYVKEKQNNEYFNILRKLNFDNDFIDEDIFKKIPQGEDFETKAKEFLENHPKYSAEDYQKQDKMFGNKRKPTINFETASDVEILQYLKENNK